MILVLCVLIVALVVLGAMWADERTKRRHAEADQRRREG